MSVTCHILETHARPQDVAVDLDLDVETDDIRIVAAFARRPLGGEFRLLADIGDGPLDVGDAVTGLHGQDLAEVEIFELRFRDLEVDPVVIRVLQGDQRRPQGNHGTFFDVFSRNDAVERRFDFCFIQGYFDLLQLGLSRFQFLLGRIGSR